MKELIGMFFKAMSGQYYPVSAIECFWAEKDANGVQREYAVLSDIGQIELFYTEYDRLAGSPFKCIPAEPGYFTLERFEDDEGKELLKNAVLGWAVEDSGAVVPITIEGVNNGDSRWDYILTPVGNVIHAGGTAYDSLEEFENG